MEITQEQKLFFLTRAYLFQYLEFSTDLDRNLIHIDKMETFVLTARLIQRTRKQQEDIKVILYPLLANITVLVLYVTVILTCCCLVFLLARYGQFLSFLGATVIPVGELA